MERIELKVEKRTLLGKKVKRLRRQGLIPAIIYGHETEPIPVQIEERELTRVLAQAGPNRLITLRLDGRPRLALAREIQRDVITDKLLHVDFYTVVMTEKLSAEVPLVLVGESPAVERREGVLQHGIDTVEVECLPGDLIHSIEVDLSELKELGQAIYVKDLKVPPSVEILTDGEEMVVKVVPIVEEVEEEEVAVAPGEVEVVTKRKEEEFEEEKEEAEE
ncbi:MAG: 50S ribosomal protein L25 [Chloroflexi bacterium]|nr:MAG: 50S ribosomal protein L25 [Chloroflexota bacterium]